MDAWLTAITDAMLETLPLTQREVVRLARDEQLDDAAIGERVNLPESVVTSRLFRARLMLDTKPKTAQKVVAKKVKHAVPAAKTVEEAPHDVASAPQSVTGVDEIRASIEKRVPGYIAAVQAAEEQLQRATAQSAGE